MVKSKHTQIFNLLFKESIKSSSLHQTEIAEMHAEFRLISRVLHTLTILIDVFAETSFGLWRCRLTCIVFRDSKYTKCIQTPWKSFAPSKHLIEVSDCKQNPLNVEYGLLSNQMLQFKIVRQVVKFTFQLPFSRSMDFGSLFFVWKVIVIKIGLFVFFSTNSTGNQQYDEYFTGKSILVVSK